MNHIFLPVSGGFVQAIRRHASPAPSSALSMPVHKRSDGKGTYYQWGNRGKKYRGKGAHEKAERQGRAAYAHGYRGKGHR